MPQPTTPAMAAGGLWNLTGVATVRVMKVSAMIAATETTGVRGMTVVRGTTNGSGMTVVRAVTVVRGLMTGDPTTGPDRSIAMTPDPVSRPTAVTDSVLLRKRDATVTTVRAGHPDGPARRVQNQAGRNPHQNHNMVPGQSAAVPLSVQILRLPEAEGLPLPGYATAGASGMDVLAAIPTSVSIPPLSWRLIPAGIAIALPAGYEAQIRPRSGLAMRHGVGVLNAPGTIDADYRGPISVILINLGTEPFDLHRGDRIAQLVIQPVIHIQWTEVSELPETGRGDGGFGHTGVR